jgi:hypothetical protein
MKNISLNLGSLQTIFKQHISILLWVFLGIVVLLEVIVIKGAIGTVLSVRNTPPVVQTSIVRVNMPMYDSVEKLLENNLSFDPSVTTNDSPFGLAPRTVQQ